MRKLTFMLVLGCTAMLTLGGAVQAGHMDGEDNDNVFTFHGEARFRGESWSNLTDFTDSVDGGHSALGVDPNGRNDDDFDIFPYRFRMSVNADLGSNVSVFGEFQGSGVFGGRLYGETPQLFGDENETIGGNVALYRGYVQLKDVGGTALDLTIGRFEINLDNGLHFSNLPFYNGISHDGAMARWDWDKFEIVGFWTRNSESNLDNLFANQGATNFVAVHTDQNSDNDILGVHFTHWIRDNDHREDVSYYAFFQTQNDPTLMVHNFDGTHDDMGKLYTVGARWGRKMDHEEGGFFWNAEYSTQFGDYQPCALVASKLFQDLNGLFGGGCDPFEKDKTLDAKGSVIEAYGGYGWVSDNWTQKVWVNYTMATGDNDPNDGDLEAFVPLFQDFHQRLGSADLWDISNIEAISVGYKAMMGEKHAFGGAIYQFTKAEKEGTNWSPLTGISIECDPNESCDDDLGGEVDLFYNYYMTNNFSFDVAWAFVDPGNAVEDDISHFGNIKDVGGDMAWRLTGQARARW